MTASARMWSSTIAVCQISNTMASVPGDAPRHMRPVPSTTRTRASSRHPQSSKMRQDRRPWPVTVTLRAAVHCSADASDLYSGGRRAQTDRRKAPDGSTCRHSRHIVIPEAFNHGTWADAPGKAFRAIHDAAKCDSSGVTYTALRGNSSAEICPLSAVS